MKMKTGVFFKLNLGSLTQINKDEAVTENITNNDNQNPPQQISSDPHDVEIKDECPQENTQTKEKKPKFKSKNDTSQKANVKSDNGKVKKEKKAIKNDVVKSSPKLNEKHAKKSQEKIVKKSPKHAPKKKKSQSIKMSNSIVKGSSSVILRKQRKVNREEYEKYSNMVIKKPFTQEPKSVETPKKNENRRKKRKVNQLEFKKYALMFNKKNPVLKKKIPKKQHKVVNQIQQISSPLEHPRIVLRKTVRRVDIEEYEKYSMMMNKKVRLPKKKSVNIQKTSKKNSKIRKNTKKNLRTLSKRVSSRRIRNHVELPTTRIRRNVGKVDKEYEKYCLMLNQKIKRKKH